MTTIRTDNNGQQVTSPPPHWLDTLLPIRALTVEMCFTEYSSPGFFHQAAVTAWLMRLLQSPDHYAFHLTIDTPEQGRCHFDEGDHYRFTLFAMGHQGEDWLTKIALLLRSGVSGIAWDRPMPFRNNWRLSALLSWPDGEAIDPQQPLTPIDQTTVAQEVAWLRTQPVITLRTTSPWRILRNKDDQLKHKGEMRFCRNSDDLVTNKTPLWLMRIGDALRALAKNRGAAVTPREAVSEITTQGDLFWVDASYSNRQGNRKPMGGLMGEIRSIKPTQLTEVQLKMLIIGQYIGIGQRRSFGYGRYQILDERGEPRFRRGASRSLLERAMEGDNLRQARAKVMEESDTDPTDVHQDDGNDAEPVRDDEKLNALASKLLHGQYRPPPLNGFIHEDADGGIRPLAAPPVYDRILQRAVHQQLSPMLDTIMERASYGFRTGRSRYQVRDLIQSLYRQGYRWVFESDIRSFFDTVTWSRLAVRLHALLGDDPAVAMILEWMQQPVRWQNRLIARQGGLPQGSPLSPVLANMMLDDFDHDLCDAGCRLIRFADDFVIVAKSRQQAEQGGLLARKALIDVGLELNEAKTRTVSFSEGFRFLGFIFVDGMAVASAPPRSDDAGKAPPQSWLAAANPTENRQSNDDLLRGEAAVPLAAYEDSDRLLIFCGEPALLFTRAGSLCIEREEEVLHRVPWNSLDAVVLFGRHHITTPALYEGMRHHVPIHMSTSSGHYHGVAISGKAGSDQSKIWLEQLRHFEDEAWALDAAKGVVDARIRHMEETLRRRGGVDESEWRARLAAALRSTAAVQSREELNGVEGNATKVYFAVLKTLVPPVFGFDGRKRRPPPDPFNALLSLGYTLIYAHLDTLLRVDGLLPVSGFYHRSHGSHSALASDLMEPFRHVVEREALNMLQGKRLRKEDFSMVDQACFLTASARRLYLGVLSMALRKPLKARGGSDALTLLEHMHRQNLSLRFALANKAKFQAWRMR